MNLVINASNVHRGGGFALLTAILEALEGSATTHVILDERMSLPTGLPENVIIYRVKPLLFARLCGEWRLRKLAGPDDTVLCFGNLPPLFKLRGKVLLFIQNRYLVERRSLKGFPMASRIKILFERFWFAWGKRNVDCFVVQTPSMQSSIMASMGKPSSVFPFSRDSKRYERSKPGKPAGKAFYDFVYTASGEPHKNHRNLVEAWTLLAKEGIKPGLRLTLDKDRFSDLCGWIEDTIKNFGLNVTNVGSISAQDLERVYQESLALIYPSDFESLGLPLIEARCAGLPILASERDYVRDAVDPEETFDPGSPVSIARAVKRFLRIPENPLPVMDAREWLSKIYEIARQ